MILDTIATLCGIVGTSSLINYFIQRKFSQKDEATRQEIKRKQEEQAVRDKERKAYEERRTKELKELNSQVQLGLETIKLLSYARMAEEADRLIRQNYATPSERRYLEELHQNYKRWGWNGDMEERLKKVYHLDTQPNDKLKE